MSRSRRSVSTSGRASVRWGSRSGRCSSRRSTRPGVEAEVDWGEALVVLGGVSVKAHLFVMRASFSGAAFCQASLVETQQAFLELHVQAFEWFGGVFPEIRFDNLKSAVKKVLKGRRRVESDRFIALRSHYLFASQFMTPGLEGAHQKGGVEGEVGRYRRNHLVPVPQLRDLAELNAMLLAGCEQDLARRIDGRAVTVGQAWAVERPLLLALPAEPFDACETAVAARRREVAGHDPPEPLLGPGPVGRVEGQRQDRRQGDHDQPRRPGGRSP